MMLVWVATLRKIDFVSCFRIFPTCSGMAGKGARGRPDEGGVDGWAEDKVSRRFVG